MDDLLATTQAKLEAALLTLKEATTYAQSIENVLKILDEGLQFTQGHYSELNALTLSRHQSLKGADIYFFFMRYTHQFFNVMNVVQSLPNTGYYQKFIHLNQARQERFEEIRADALAKGQEILKH